MQCILKFESSIFKVHFYARAPLLLFSGDIPFGQSRGSAGGKARAPNTLFSLLHPFSRPFFLSLLFFSSAITPFVNSRILDTFLSCFISVRCLFALSLSPRYLRSYALSSLHPISSALYETPAKSNVVFPFSPCIFEITQVLFPRGALNKYAPRQVLCRAPGLGIYVCSCVEGG